MVLYYVYATILHVIKAKPKLMGSAYVTLQSINFLILSIMNEIAKGQLYYIFGLITNETMSKIEFDEKLQRYFIESRFTFTEEEFKALKLAWKEIVSPK